MAYLKYNLNFPPDKRVYVIGEAGLEHELELEGIKFVGGTDPEENQFFPSMDFVGCGSVPPERLPLVDRFEGVPC